MMPTMHTQVRMERAGSIDIAFIPAAFAQVGRRVRLKRDEAGWQDGWTVTEVYGSLPSDTVAKNERNYKSHRKGTDI